MGAPVEGAKEALDRLANVGHTIIIFTVMAVTENGKQAVKDWLDYYDIMYHEVTAIKPNADVFLDDKAIRFINWEQALADIQNLW